MVLLPKEEKPAGESSAYRPICLLNEAEKLLLATFPVTCLRLQLADCQFGFRRNPRSTINAIQEVRAFSDLAISHVELALAISLNIFNVFNFMSWTTISKPSYIIMCLLSRSSEGWIAASRGSAGILAIGYYLQYNFACSLAYRCNDRLDIMITCGRYVRSRWREHRENHSPRRARWSQSSIDMALKDRSYIMILSAYSPRDCESPKSISKMRLWNTSHSIWIISGVLMSISTVWFNSRGQQSSFAAYCQI